MLNKCETLNPASLIIFCFLEFLCRTVSSLTFLLCRGPNLKALWIQLNLQMWFHQCQIVGKCDFPRPAGSAFATVVQYVVNLHHRTRTVIIHVIMRTTRSFWQSFCAASQSPGCTCALSCPGPVAALTSVIAELHEPSVSPCLCFAEVPLNGSPPVWVFDCSP